MLTIYIIPDQFTQEVLGVWRTSVRNEFKRMVSDIRIIKGNNVLVFIPKSEVQSHKKVTYGNMICDH